MRNNVRKPSIVLSGLPLQLATALRPVKEVIEQITGATRGMPELQGLQSDADNKQVIKLLNDIVKRLNASGDDHVR